MNLNTISFFALVVVVVGKAKKYLKIMYHYSMNLKIIIMKNGRFALFVLESFGLGHPPKSILLHIMLLPSFRVLTSSKCYKILSL